uniref:HTH psq-type domain-containing protein n=1 Tax=Anopheles minimus TaxID=112268 RepID=A0A182VVQ9_9DIPT
IRTDIRSDSRPEKCLFTLCGEGNNSCEKVWSIICVNHSEKLGNMADSRDSIRCRKSSNPYTRQDLKNAINLIVERGTSIRRAAFVCNVPRTTLSTYLKSLKHGKISKLFPQEEQALYQWMTDCCKRGFSIKKRNVETAAEALVQKNVPARTHPFQDTEFGRRCYQKFVKRWFSIDRVSDRKHLGAIMDWYLHIERYLSESNFFEILNHPARVFLCDELRFRERVEMNESVRTLLKKMTMLYTFTALGQHLSPLLVYPYRRDVPPHIVQAAPKNCAIVAHEYGQVTPKTFAAYLDKVVDKFVTTHNIPKPVIMFVDESQVDLTLHLHNTCKRLGIILIGLSAAQVVKPTANAFNDICNGWEQELPKWETENGREFTLAECAGLMQQINQRYINSTVLVKDFASSNLCPWNRPIREKVDNNAVVVNDDMEPEEDEDDDIEIEHFLENVDDWSDGDEGEDLDFEDDERMDEFNDMDENDDDSSAEDGITKKAKEDKDVIVEKTETKTSTAESADTDLEKMNPAADKPEINDAGCSNPAQKMKANATTEGKESVKTLQASHQVSNSETDDNEDGPPDDIDISINFIDFKRAIGSELTEKFERKLEIENRLPLANHAENVLFDIYRQFRCDILTDSDDDYDIVEVGDD